MAGPARDLSRARRWLPRALAVALTVVLFGFARLPQLSERERQALASHFHFQRQTLGAATTSTRSLRRVHPSVEHIAGWISSVGASVALGDVDGDGLPNDACLV